MDTIATLKDLVDALTETGIENNNIEVITTDLKSFFKLLSENDELKNVLASEAFEAAERKEILSDVCNGFDVLFFFSFMLFK